MYSSSTCILCSRRLYGSQDSTKIGLDQNFHFHDENVQLDEAKRKEIYAETQEILNMEGGPVIPLFMWQVDAATTKIKTPKLVGGQFGLDYFRAARRWWFES